MRISDWSSDVCSSDLRRQLLDARQSLRRPLTEADVQAAPAEQMRYTRTARNEVYRQFQRLPNPDLVMYVYPHLAGTDPVPVPGYTTVFPLYQRVQYAMPGERVEDSCCAGNSPGRSWPHPALARTSSRPDRKSTRLN